MNNLTQIEVHIQALANPNILVRQPAKEALIELGSAAVEPLLAAMKNETSRICWEAASVLSQIDDPRWIAPMQNALMSSNCVLGQVAVKALKNLNMDISDVFIQSLPRCHYTVQIHIVVALEKYRNKHAAVPLMKMLRNTNSPTLKYCIIQTLGALGDTRSIEIIRAFEQDEDQHVRTRARIALENLQTIANNEASIH